MRTASSAGSTCARACGVSDPRVRARPWRCYAAAAADSTPPPLQAPGRSRSSWAEMGRRSRRRTRSWSTRPGLKDSGSATTSRRGWPSCSRRNTAPRSCRRRSRIPRRVRLLQELRDRAAVCARRRSSHRRGTSEDPGKTIISRGLLKEYNFTDPHRKSGPSGALANRGQPADRSFPPRCRSSRRSRARRPRRSSVPPPTAMPCCNHSALAPMATAWLATSGVSPLGRNTLTMSTGTGTSASVA